ncbi:hypothetical protein ACOSQ4_016998 [Xanthoceras sorbifolium]
MLESIGKLQKFKKTIDQANNFTIFIYAHHKTLSLMRSFTKKRDIVRPRVTRFASSFLTLQSMMEQKSQLKTIFCSELWDQCKWSNTTKGQKTYVTVMSTSFWNGVTTCLKVFASLVKVLRLVDWDKKPAMGFVYGELLQVKEDIKVALNNVDKNYKPITDIIDVRIKSRLDSSLHLATYFLNSYYCYRDATIKDKVDVNLAMFECVEAICGMENFEMQDTIANSEIRKYKMKEGSFGKPLAISECKNNREEYNPGTIFKVVVVVLYFFFFFNIMF